MPRQPRHLVHAGSVLAMLMAASGAQAFSDSNADMKEQLADRQFQRAEARARAAPRLWVPPTRLALDGFRPAVTPARQPGGLPPSGASAVPGAAPGAGGKSRL